MAAFFVATSRIKNPEKFARYAAATLPTFNAHGGELVIRGKKEATLSGAAAGESVAVVRFADIGALNGWFNSSEYQALVPLRDEAADMTLTAYSVPA